MSVAFTDEEQRALRGQLPAVQRIAYLNAGTLGPLPLVARDAMQREHDYDAQVRQSVDHWERLAALQGAARGALTALTGVGADQVALMPSTHAGLNACLWGMSLRAGDNVVTTDEEHPGLLVPLAHVRARAGVDVRTSTWRDDPQAFVDATSALVDERTRALVLSHVSWISGRTAPLRTLRDAVGPDVRIIVDGAQSAGVLAVDPTDGWDAYTVSGQKWPCGPNGSGGLALVDPEAWLPTFGAYAQLTDHDPCDVSKLVPDGRRLETSQEALAPLSGFAASVRWLVTEVGAWRALAHARQLNARARQRLERAGVDPAGLHGDAHLLCIDVPDARAESIALALVESGFLVRNLGTSRLRLCFGWWNTDGEVDGAVDALAGLLATSGGVS